MVVGGGGGGCGCGGGGGSSSSRRRNSINSICSLNPHASGWVSPGGSEGRIVNSSL